MTGDADEQERRTQVRHLSERLAVASWCGDRDAAALLADQIDRLEHDTDHP